MGSEFASVGRVVALAALGAFGCSSHDGTGTTGTGGFRFRSSGSGGAAASISGGAPNAASPGGMGGTLAGGGGPVSSSGGAPPESGGAVGSGGTTGGAGGAGGAGAAAPAGVDAGGGADGGEADSGAANEGTPPCLTDSSEIVMIGDSYVNWITHTFPQDMNTASMLDIADFAVGGTSMGSGGIGLIPPQFDTALGTHPKIIAVIMDGGGNDILVPDLGMFPDGAECKAMGAASPSIPECQAIVQKALDAGTALFLHMAASGVRDAVYFFYPHVPTGTWLAQDPNGMLDYALPKIQAACEGAYAESLKADPNEPIRCHFVNLVPVFDGHPEYFATNDLHPNSTGSKAMAASVWAKMKTDCVAQPASSGCCMPE